MQAVFTATVKCFLLLILRLVPGPGPGPGPGLALFCMNLDRSRKSRQGPALPVAGSLQNFKHYYYKMRFVFAASFSVVVTATFSVPNVPLKNAAKPGVVMPAVGLGTFGYSTVPVNGDCRTYPECWNELSGCGSVVTNVTSVFLELATSASSPIRIDSADDYFDMTAVGSSIASSGIPRNNIFVTSKIGNAFAMG
jgi:hypothetical protein